MEFLITPRRRGYPFASIGLLILVSLLLLACEPASPPESESDIQYRRSGVVQSNQLDEISGLQASRRHANVLWTHNDDGPARLHALGSDGRDLGYVDIEQGVNVDWEDMALIPGRDRDLLVMADIGDNRARRDKIWLFLVEEPEPDANGQFGGTQTAYQWISLTYEDGARDAESIAWDPIGQQLLILSKRDQPPRLYALDLRTALDNGEAELGFVGTVNSFRPPTPSDARVFGDRTPWISQATGMDISADGRWAAIISYRSLYLFRHDQQNDWLATLNTKPVEIVGPRGDSEEAVSFGPENNELWVSGEGPGADLFEYRLNDVVTEQAPEVSTQNQ